MSKDQFDTHLRYGQGILIKGYKKESSGIMTTKGFADTRARFQTYDDILFFKNYRNAIFQILPASSFDINDELRYLVENNIENTGGNLEILKAKAKSQHDQFDLTIKSKEKSLVCYGDEVVLKHVDSGTYLSGTIRPAEGKNGAFSVQATKDLKASLIFKLLPYRSFQNQSNPIPLQSPIIIENVFNKGSLTFQRFVKQQKKQRIHLQKAPIKSDESYKIPVKTDSNNEIYECVTHFCDLSVQNVQEQMPWKFQLHFNDVQNDNLIQHDIVYFQHTLNNGVLAAAVDQEIVLKELKGEKTSELSFYDCLWQIEEYKDKGENNYILRHLMSGMVLGVDTVKSDDRQILIKPKLIDISDGKTNQPQQNDKLGSIELKLAKKQGGNISSKSYINICYGQECLDIAKEKDKEANKRDIESKALYQSENYKVDARESYVDIQKLMSMANNQFSFEVKKLQFTNNISKHCFVIQEIDNELKAEVLFALSFHSRLINLREDLKWGAAESERKVSYLRMMQITEKTKEIKYFLKNTTTEDPNREFKRPVPKRQIICFHLGISELLFELLFFMRKNRDGQEGFKDGKPEYGVKIFATKPNELQKFIQMYNGIYEVIFELIRDNLQFKIHVSKWITFIFEDVIRNNEEYQLKTLLELLKNNSFFVNNFVTEELMGYLVDRMLKNNPNKSHQFLEKKYIEIFRAFCICGDEVNSDNQVLILKKFIKRLTEDVEGLKYEIKLSKRKNEQQKIQQIGCTAAIDKNTAKWRKFNDYYKICRDEYPTAWQYMISYLHLIADMCRGRNKIVQSYIDTTMTLEVLTQLMTKEKLFDAEVPIIRIIHYLYAENQNFYPIDRITRVCNYQKIDEEIKINSTKSQVRPIQLLGPVMSSLIQKLKAYGPIEVKNVGKNECLYAILNFLKETFLLGFWQQKSQVEQIYTSVSRLIEPEPDINYKQITEQSQKPEIVLMVSCKQKCVEILELIIDLDIDFYLKHLSRTFKEFQIPVRKMEVQLENFLEIGEESKFSVDFFNKFKADHASLKPIVSTQICPKIIQLSKHNHPKLTSFSLKILQRILDFNRHVSDGFVNMIFVCEDVRIDLHRFIEDKRDKFFTLEYQTTTKINQKNQSNLYFMVYLDEKDAGIMQDLYMISQLVKNQNSLARMRDIKTLDSSGTHLKLADERLLNFTSQRKSSNKMKQNVVDASNIHQKVLRYIFNCKQMPTQKLAQKLLHLCYRFLVSIIENNQELKLTLIPHTPKMMHHITRNIGCIDFFKEMYDNNKNMLYNEAEILKLIKLVCSQIEEQDKSRSYYKSKLLDFFRYLIYCNGRAFSYNQIQILKIMQDDSFKNIIFDITPQKIKTLVATYTQMNSKEPEEGATKCIAMEPELTYMVTFFQIMISLIDDKCKVNAGKLVKKFPFDKLVECLVAAQRCWPLKRNIRAFLNRLYYFESEIETYISIIRTKQIQNLINDMNYFIEIKCKTNVAEFEAAYFDNPVRFSFLESYLYLNLEENLFTLYQIVKNQKLVNQFKNFLHSAKSNSKSGPYNFIRICERLGWIRNYFSFQKNIFSTSFIKFLLSQLRKIIEEFDDNIYSQGMMFGGELVPTKQEKDKSRKLLIEKIMLGEISTFFVQNAAQVREQKPLVYQTPPKFTVPRDPKIQNRQKLIRKLREVLTRTMRLFDNEDDRIEDKQSKLISALKLSKEINEEFSIMYNERLKKIIEENTKLLMDREEKRVQQLKIKQAEQQKKHQQSNSQNPEASPKTPAPETKAIESIVATTEDSVSEFESLLEYVSSIIRINSISPDVFSPQLKIFFLKMIIGIIEQSNKTQMEQKKPIDEWKGEDWEKYSGEIEKIQIRLKSGHLGTLIAEILKENIIDNLALANSTLLCGIAYLLGGNQVTQKNLIEQIQKDPDNRVFRNLDSLISKLGKIILKNIDESNQMPPDSREFHVEIIDNYDFYDEKQKYCCRKNVIEASSTNDVIYYRDCKTTYRRAFRFLQLLCENNNVDNKNYIRDQPGKMQPVNFITMTTNELRNLFEVMCKQIVDVPTFLLEFLMEVTQIPVKQNQEALMNSSFFEDLCQMSNQFAKEGKAAMRGFEDGMDPLQEIYTKSVQIILSNFEGNQENTYTILDSKLDPKFLVNILQNKFQSLGLKNKEELLKYMKKSLETVNEKGEKVISTMFPEQIMGLFDILIIFMKLKEKLGDRSRLYSSYLKFREQKNQQIDRTPMLQHLQKSLIHIQINNSNKQKHTIYFAKHPCFYSLSQSIRDYVMSVVKRQTHRDKIVSLIGYTNTIKQSIQYSYRLEKSEGVIESNMTQCYKAAAFMSVVICVFLFMFYGVIIEYGDVQFTSNRIVRSVRFVLSLMQLSMSICYAYYWLLLKIWHQPEYKPKESEKNGAAAVVETKPAQQKFYNNLNFYRLLLFVGVSFYGTFIDPTFFFIHIIDIFCQSALLANIFKAIAQTFVPVALVSFMGVIFVVVFCTVSFSNYTKDVYQEKQILKGSQELCDSMMSCLMALYVSGTIGESMEVFEMERFIYDTIYAIFFGLLFGNIISGIMLDAFGSLREKNDNLKSDKSNTCYICNIPREQLEKRKIKFKQHITQKHFLWNYAFYIISLNAKNKTDYTGLEYEIIQQYNQTDQDMKIDWIPDGEEADYDPVEDIKGMIGVVEGFNGGVQRLVGEFEAAVKEFGEKAEELEAQ